jgi:uncharacterized protein YihD (DUF1040 family)
MRDPKRIPKILKRIEKIWKKYPDLRLGQLIIDGTLLSGEEDLFYIEDEKLISKLEKFEEKLEYF